jgi:hypothetical protein
VDQIHFKVKQAVGPVDTVLQGLIGCMNRSVEMMVDTVKEGRTTEIIAREFCERKVSV